MALIVAVLVASVTVPLLPGAQTAKTEPRSESFAPAPPPQDAEEPANKEDKESAYEKLAINKLTIERPEPEEPEPEEAEEPVPAEEPAPERREESPDDGANAERTAGASVDMLPGRSSESGAEERRSTEQRAAEQRAAERRSRLAGVENAKPVSRPESGDERLWLTVPRAGLSDLPVGDSPRQAYLDREGVMHLSGTGFPSERGSNTYIAGHASGYDSARYPNAFRDLPNVRKGDLIAVRDGTMRTYRYRVYERIVVTPYDVWVTKPVAGKQIVSLQTCYPAPTYEKRLIVRAELIK